MVVSSPQTGAAPSVPRLFRPITLGVLVGNRGFFPKHLVTEGRAKILEVLARAGIRALILDENETAYGAIESVQEARAYGEFFKAHASEIDGVLVTLPNFGDERAIANALRFSGLNVPVLIHAFPDDATRMAITDRRDSFCGKMSACNNLKQYGIAYSLTTLHTVDPDSALFMQDLKRFERVCRVVRGLRSARLGALGARPTAFNTVRYSEKLLERSGISVETLDLSEAFGRINHINETDARYLAKRQAIANYARIDDTPEHALVKMAKLGVVIDDWMEVNQLDASAIQCWTSMEEFYGIVPCTLMSMASNNLTPSACETDIVGTVSMLALALASGKPSALLDWNNNYGDDPDKGVVFHCSNLPRDVFVDEIPVMNYQEIIAGTVGAENTYGTIYGRIRENPFTYMRVSTDELSGKIRVYVGEGAFTNDPIDTFGGYGVVQVPHFQTLLRFICDEGFEHHVAANHALVADVLYEALTKYMGWDVYYHK